MLVDICIFCRENLGHRNHACPRHSTLTQSITYWSIHSLVPTPCLAFQMRNWGIFRGGGEEFCGFQSEILGYVILYYLLLFLPWKFSFTVSVRLQGEGFRPPPPFPFPLSLASGAFVLEESKIWFCFFWFVKVNPKTTPKQPQKIVSSYLTLSFINFENVFFQLNKKNRVRVNNGAQEIMKTGNINNFCFHYFHRC